MNLKMFYATTGLALLPFAASPAAAQEVRLGVGASLINPIGGMGDYGKSGFGASLALEFVKNDNIAIRQRVEYVALGEKKEYFAEYQRTVTSTSGWLEMTDFVYGFGDHEEGWYVFGGAGAIVCKYGHNDEFRSQPEQDVGYQGDWQPSSHNGSSDTVIYLGISGGVGYNFYENLGVEVSITQSAIGLNKRNYPAFSCVQASARWRF